MPSKNAAYWQQGVFAVLLAAAIVAFNIWTVQSVTPDAVRLFGGDQGDYSNLVMRSLRERHTYVDVTPAPELIRAKNPYDSATRPKVAVLSDASFYKGRYYIYFGVAPVVTLFLPWRLVTGHELPAPYAALILVNGAFLVSTVLWWKIRRRYFPDSGVVALATGILVIGLGSMTHSVLRRVSIWEPPVAAGYFFAVLTLACVYAGLHGRRRLSWFALGSLFLGLAVGSRPTYLVGIAALAVPLALEWLRGRRAGSPSAWPDGRWWAQAVALGAPFGLIFAALLGYNYARFENPFEFGMHYQLTGAYEAAVRHFSSAYVRFNAYVYYWAPAQWSRYFPFAEPIRMPPAPSGYETCEYVYGILTNIPFAWVALFSPLALLRRRADESRPLGDFLGVLAALYVSLGVFLLFFVTSTARYMLDFTPALMLLACVGLLALERLAPGKGARRLVLTVCAGAGLLSAFVCAMLNFQLQDLLRQLNPPLFRSLSHAFDEPVWQVERRLGTQFGPLEITLRFPADRAGRTEPLVTTGWEFFSDYLYVNYPDNRSVRIGFSHAGYPERWSRPLRLDLGAEHRLRVEMGSLFPPRGHPYFDGLDDLQYGSVARWLSVSLDGSVVLEGPQDFYDGSPGSLLIGSEPTNSYGGKFTGTISRVARVPSEAVASPSAPSGPVRLTLSIPSNVAGRQVPLLSTGSRGRGDALLMRAIRPGVVRFYYDHWGSNLIASADVAVDGLGAHELLLSMPSLWPGGGDPDSPLRHTLFLSLDGRTLAAQEVEGFPAAQGEVFFARNGIGSSVCEPDYPWVMRSVREEALTASSLLSGGPIAKWVAPTDQGAIQREAPAGSDDYKIAAQQALRVRNGLLTAARIWAVLMVWIVGRLMGLRWTAFFIGTFFAVIRPFFGPARWTWRHKGSIALTIALVAAAVVGLRLRLGYLRAAGPMRLRLMLPSDRQTLQQPIVSTGKSGAGAMVYVTYTDKDHIQMGADIWGALYLSDPIEVDYSKPQEIVVNTSGLYPLDHPRVLGFGAEILEQLRNDFFVSVDGRTVLSGTRSAYDSKASEVTVGSNRIGSSYSAPTFTGRVLSVDRLSFVRELRILSGQEARVRFRTGSGEKADQPLISLGANGSMGTCFVRLDGGSLLRVCYRSSDGQVSESAPFADPPGALHELELVPGFVDNDGLRSAAFIRLDGRTVADPKGLAHFLGCPAILGVDLNAGPGVGQFFGGPDLSASVASIRAPVSSPQPPGAVLLLVKFPSGRTGSEPLLVSGATGAGDFVYVTYVARNQLQFGFDHWGSGGKVGEPVDFDPTLLHRLEIDSAGASPLGAAQVGVVRARLDGVTVLEGTSPIHPHTQAQVFIGSNPVGGSTCGPEFHGEIVDLNSRD